MEGFKEIIRRPKSFNEASKAAIEADLGKLKSMLADFGVFYTTANLPKNETPPETAFFTMATLQVGLGLFNDIKKVVAGERENIAVRFETETKLKKWDQL